MDDDQVRPVAYQCWEDRGRPEGDPHADWFMAINILGRTEADSQQHDAKAAWDNEGGKMSPTSNNGEPGEDAPPAPA